jgi:phosphoglycolate phosphatase
MNRRTKMTSQPNRPKLLLFDIDGTLVNTHGGSLRAMTAAAEQTFGVPFDLKKVNRLGQLDPQIIAEALQQNQIEAADAQVDLFINRYFEILPDEMHTSQVLPGVFDLLRKLRVADKTVLGLVSGNFSQSARIKLLGVGIDPQWFVANAFGGDGRTRADLVRHAIAHAAQLLDARLPPQDVIVIGDTPHDVASAQANGCRSVAVSSGWVTAATLGESKPDVLLDDLTDHRPIWDMLEWT